MHKPQILEQPRTRYRAKGKNRPATLSVRAQGHVPSAPLTYQWQQRDANGEWKDKSGETQPRLKISKVDGASSLTYRVKITEKIDGTNVTIDSQPAALRQADWQEVEQYAIRWIPTLKKCSLLLKPKGTAKWVKVGVFDAQEIAHFGALWKPAKVWYDTTRRLLHFAS